MARKRALGTYASVPPPDRGLAIGNEADVWSRRLLRTQDRTERDLEARLFAQAILMLDSPPFRRQPENLAPWMIRSGG